MTGQQRQSRTARRFRRGMTAGAGLAAAALVLSACGGGSDAGDGGQGSEDAEFLTIATGGSSGVYYQIGATMADMLREELGSDTSVQATGATAENINLLTDGNAELAFAMGDAVVQALEGTGPFEDDAREGLVAIAALYPNTVQLVATTASGIESVEDLAGRNVAVGDVGSGVELNAQMVLGAYDLSYDDINADYLSYAEATDQMANGHIDAAFVTSGVPNPTLTELGTNTDFIVVPIDGDGAETLLTEYDFFSEDVVPGGTYLQEEDVPTVGVTNHLLVGEQLSEDAVYDITATLFDNLDRLHGSHSAAEVITLETVTEGLVVPLHPGAERYFDEQGVL
ncbi:TAXI family TRAP transporter solute-binding subunit [Sediminivirga luteola]|uniref:C4-dicarboxylate ABC transporter n=1 Tax=Sediminivirga luteola TaxID=1774748 RepID=A0A8J2TWN1_9MICO|nr:TAXI family TRAP transporter solute-binding subunit [Sediminivirga luteola]MCI2263925.1 TAXI family TRAP transporter solute-binding subunit [Sediminivirga luteola]GGA08737.1 C4-dicarboxylate ABC transporter [Sediminivirga luteola]